MSGYDPYGYPSRERSYRYEERRERDPRYADRDSGYLKPNVGSRDLVRRHREDSELSVEEIPRDFPPYGQRDIRRARSAEPGFYDPRDRDLERSHHRGPSSMYYAEEEREKSRRRVLSKQEKIIAAVAGAALAIGGKEVFDRRGAKEEGHDVERNYLTSAALAAGGAFAGYQGADFYNKKVGREEKKHGYALHRGRDGKITETFYSDDEGDSTAKKGHKSFLENALGVTSLGAAFKALTGDDKDDRRSRGRRGSSSSSSRSRSGGNSRSKIQKAAMASLIAGATEAFRVSKEPGGWKGEKAKRIVTAALGAGAFDAAQDSEKSGKLGLAESVIGGLVGNRLVHGSKKNIEEDRRTGRSRSVSRARSEGRGGIAALATAGLGAIGAKKVLGSRSRSQSRGRSDSDGSRSPSRRQRSRSRSIVDKSRKALAKFGIGHASDDDRRQRDLDDGHDSPRSSRRTRGHRDDYDDDDDDSDDYRGSTRGGGRSDAYDDRSHRSSRRGKDTRSDAGSESSLGDSDEDRKKARKMKGKQILTTGLAAVASIHAAHEVYESMEKRNQRHKAVKEGRLSPEEAKKLKTKALLQDAASVGIAAMGIKGALSNLKEARDLQHECKEFHEMKARRHERRIERQRSLGGGSLGRRRADNWSTSVPPRSDRSGSGARYFDDNPYSAALPAPPVGHDRR